METYVLVDFHLTAIFHVLLLLLYSQTTASMALRLVSMTARAKVIGSILAQATHFFFAETWLFVLVWVFLCKYICL